MDSMVPQGRLRIVKTSRGVRNCGRSEHRRGSISKTRTVLMGCCEGLARWASPSWCLRHGATRASVPLPLAGPSCCPNRVSWCRASRPASPVAMPLWSCCLSGRGAAGSGAAGRVRSRCPWSRWRCATSFRGRHGDKSDTSCRGCGDKSDCARSAVGDKSDMSCKACDDKSAIAAASDPRTLI